MIMIPDSVPYLDPSMVDVRSSGDESSRASVNSMAACGTRLAVHGVT